MKSLLSKFAFGFAAVLLTSASIYAIDTDSDGLDDSVETGTGTYVSPTNTGTNPNAVDTDGDGVADGIEVREKTSPIDATKFHAFSQGMVGYFPFDTDIKDYSGNGKDGTLIDGGSISAVVQNGYASFNGYSTAIATNIDSNITSLSYSFWFRVRELDRSAAPLIDSDVGGHFGHDILAGYYSLQNFPNSVPNNQICILAHDAWYKTSVPIEHFKWNHCAVSYSSKIELWLNGVLVYGSSAESVGELWLG